MIFRICTYITINLLFIQLGAAYSAGLKEFYRGVRASALGYAVTAISDDYDSVFYNPAGIAFNRGLEMSLVNPKIEGSKDDITTVTDITKITSSGFNASAMNALFGKNIYLGATAFPAIFFPHLVLGYYYGTHMHISPKNLALPSIGVDYVYDHGFIGGTGFETSGFSRKDFFRFGLTLKWLTRVGYDDSIPITSLVSLDQSYLKTLKSESASGWGLGLGFQYEFLLKKGQNLVLGTAWQDIGDTQFGGRSIGRRPPSIPNNLTAGAAWIYRIGAGIQSNTNLKLAIEGRHLADVSKKDPLLLVHSGLELQLGDISVQGGVSQAAFSAGLSWDAPFVQISAATYGVENQSLARLDSERRYIGQFTFKLDMFDFKTKTKRDKVMRRRPRDF